MSIKHLDEAFDAWGSWGVGDFYQRPEQLLREVIENGKPFDTGWHDWTKELQSMRIVRKKHATHIKCHAFMDDPYEDHELLGDFLEDGEWEKLDDEALEELENEFFQNDISDNADEECDLPYDASLDDIIHKAKELMDACESRLNESFKRCITITLIRLYGTDEKAQAIIEERIKNCCKPAKEGAEK